MAMSQPIVQKLIPTTGQTVQMINSDNNLMVMLEPATDIAALTLNWPTVPHSGQIAIVSSTKNITALSHTGSTLSKNVTSMSSLDSFVYEYDDLDSTWALISSTKAPKIFLPYSVTTTGGTSTIYLTDSGLVGGNPLFSSVDFVHINFVSNDPNFGRSYTLSGVTLTITAVKQVFNGVTILGINALGSVAIAAAANGTALLVLVQGTPV